MKTAPTICGKCGAEVSADAWQGACPACLLQTGLGLLTDEAVAGGDGGSARRDETMNAFGERVPPPRTPHSTKMLGDFGDYELYAHDEKLATVAWLKEPLRPWLAKAETQAPRKVAAIDSIAKAVQVNRPYHLPVIARPSGICTDDTWTPTTLTTAPVARDTHTAVWTGTEMIVWGGTPGPLNTGGRYDPGTDSWTARSTTNAPSRTIAAQGSLDRHVDRRFVGPRRNWAP